MSFQLIIILTILINNYICFNIEERNPIVKRAKESGSYFGFSVAQHSENSDTINIDKNWILVGAPLGQNLQPRSNHSGALYKCPITRNTSDCIQVVTDGRRLNEFDYDGTSDNKSIPLEPPGVDEIKDGQWLGVNVRSQRPGGKVIVCAHRYIQSPNLKFHHYGLGLCYLLNNYLEIEEDLQPCKGRPVEKLHEQYGFCQVGTSLALLDDGIALIGSPGPNTWRGMIFAKEVVGEFLEKDKTTYHGPLNDSRVDKYSYIGMSVAGGYFFNKKLTYVAGAPHSELNGQIFFFSQKYHQEQLNITLILTGEQFASGYGNELLATDINNDGYDDLLVGAPFYFDNIHGGAVYVYYNLRNCQKNICKHTVLKGKPYSRFGFAMTSIGDINHDGYNDVAIGAPFESDTGAIYIYLGSNKGLQKEPSQIIKHSQLKTLGYALNGGLDMDGNGYPDLLVGAYESDLVILYKTRAIIDINIKIIGDELTNINASRKGCKTDPLNQNNTCFTFYTCFTMNGLQDNIKPFKVHYHLHELTTKTPRIWLRNLEHPYKHEAQNDSSIWIDHPKKSYCQEETVYISETNKDILSPIKFIVNYTLENNTIDSPLLNKTSVKYFSATFQKNCGNDDVCESYLVLDATTNLEKLDDGFMMNMGKNREFQLEINVTNQGEPAYETGLYILHSNTLSYIALVDNPSLCSYENSTMVKCNLSNPLNGNEKIKLRIRFEVSDNITDKSVEFYLIVNSTSRELSKKNKKFLIIYLEKIAEYTITGKAITQSVHYAGLIKGESAMETLDDIGSRVIHRYDIQNNGDLHIQDLNIKILWPQQINSTNNIGKWLLYLEHIPLINGEQNYCLIEPTNALNPLGLGNVLEKNPNNSKRKKRDVERIIPAEIIMGGDKKQRRVVTIDCHQNTARCIQIHCRIKYLNKREQISIDIESRIWNSTLVEDYSNVDYIRIRSFAEIVMTDSTVTTSSTSITTAFAETNAYPNIMADTSLNIWIIIGSVLAGLLLLILLIFLLYKVGFFKRNRLKEQTMSGNLKKQGESESLLKVNEGNGGNGKT